MAENGTRNIFGVPTATGVSGFTASASSPKGATKRSTEAWDERVQRRRSSHATKHATEKTAAIQDEWTFGSFAEFDPQTTHLKISHHLASLLTALLLLLYRGKSFGRFSSQRSQARRLLDHALINLASRLGTATSYIIHTPRSALSVSATSVWHDRVHLCTALTRRRSIVSRCGSRVS
jgi:hypothetical protein